MNTDDLNFAYKVRHALNDNLEYLPASTSERLATARKIALSRKKPQGAAVRVAQPVLAGRAAQLLSFSWLGRMGVAVPLMALVVGLTVIYQYEEEQRIAELAELDAAVLSDELPLTAYLDQGFNAYVSQRAQ